MHPSDAIVRVPRSCICGSDLHIYHGLVPDTRVGSAFGHAFIGEVIEVGKDVQKLKVGDQVIVPFNISCGQCAFCKQGLFGDCHESNPMATAVGGIFGYSHTAGGQAEFVRVPYTDVGPMVIPADMDPDDAVVSIDAVGCEAAGSALQTITGRKLMLQAGSATALHWAINSVKKGGIVSIVGVYGPTDNLVPIGNVVNKGLTIRANQASVKRLLPRLIEHVPVRRLNPKGIITHRVPLEEVAEAYHIFSSKLDNCIKTVLIPPSARN